MPSDCVFCKIVEGKLPCYKVYENREFMAFLDRTPVNKGHTLLVPKAHYESLEKLPDTLSEKLILTLKKLVVPVASAVGSPGVNIGLNNAPVAGRLIPHVHFHIMPRFENDGYRLWEGKKLSEDEMKKIAQKIKNSL